MQQLVTIFLETIHGAAANETFKKSFINNPIIHPFAEVHDIRIQTMLIALANQAIDGIIPYVLDTAKAETNSIVLYGEATLRIVNIWA